MRRSAVPPTRRLRPGWADRVPAIGHLDGTARPQITDASLSTATARTLAAYEQLGGVPVLCDTSANLNGRDSSLMWHPRPSGAAPATSGRRASCTRTRGVAGGVQRAADDIDRHRQASTASTTSTGASAQHAVVSPATSVV
ncbi:carbamoyltransferase C-terminal domain-containing protein [Streptomyces sp. NPDC001793]|uniref:carbamoyltransferase C-terminal domain-containing protein n=1 Tax=Streptomyces sp. NPDC001793 TaxID=3154657 RepID=UPI00331A4031